jgi:MFS family permease
VLLDKIQANAPNAKNIIVNVTLVTNAFVWYYFIMEFLQGAVQTAQLDQNTIFLVWALHFAGIAFSALTGALLSNRIRNRQKFILYWMLIGVILSGFAIIANLTSVSVILLLSLLFGVSLGIGMPSCMGFFTEKIAVDHRGRLGGIIFLLSGLIMVGLGLLAGENLGLQTYILFGWRLFGLIIFLLFLSSVQKPISQQIIKDRAVSYKSVITQKSFFLYLIPWTLFALITYLSVPIQTTTIQQLQTNGVVIPSAEDLKGIENLLLAISAVVCGFLADTIGRKRVAIVGFALLGLGYSFVGISPETPICWYIYTIFDGIALGILYVIFVITIWSDVSDGAPSEKYYAVGVLPFFISYLLRLVTNNEIASNIPATSIFSFIAVFLFIAVLPLVYAPETLPEKQMKDRELKNYIEKAQKIAQKEEKKSKKADDKKQAEADDKNSEEYKKAKALAEKYY